MPSKPGKNLGQIIFISFSSFRWGGADLPIWVIITFNETIMLLQEGRPVSDYGDGAFH